MPMVKRRHNAPDNICDSRLDEGQAEDIAVASLCGGLQVRADRAPEDAEGAGAGLAERPAEDAVADSVTVALRVVGPTEFGDIELELPDGYYTGQGDSSVYVCSDEVLEDARG